MSNSNTSNPPVPTLAEIEAAEAKADALAEAQAEENRLFEALWHGDVDGENFDGDPADLW